ncbi:beta-glucan synthesis-associated protein KRE6 [Coprinopsis cinerea okayama7|uniref:Beta-glucan synthesis-associated protein KRE6 n=1 Tax=Coprinopsis cinerea (strain Okayama-7 / 130 / ATCC MYA-4618 / FGSC 9003) TaxID=240176 RepID=A8NIX7_COPC7|nr:beta-glucan synthesis-associated protein KRE6 [Coprinopsis cinerea okayama7\|eukprot:XP_001834095.2 beta-glucan synthesis-associated protein KRE6 [Coprinopsis cinerea okayama7\
MSIVEQARKRFEPRPYSTQSASSNYSTNSRAGFSPQTSSAQSSISEKLLTRISPSSSGGLPVYSIIRDVKQTRQGGFNYGGINGTGQIPQLIGNYGLIDRDTPLEARTKFSYHTGEEMVLVFSDEFNEDGRTFYPGDDPYWEAVDLWYWGTVNLEWYDPSQVTTSGGSLRLHLDRVDDPSTNHNMSFKGGMLQSWNKFCFTGGLIEASVQLGGSPDVGGLWPAVWTMGNLGRAGYGATLEGLWPYSYDECDVGTTKNQTYPWDKTRPEQATVEGDGLYDDVLSYLPGQRLSACTCPGESHPGPMRSNGYFVGRAAPEIDVLEAIVEDGVAQISQSAQWAPFNAQYATIDSENSIIFHNTSTTTFNPFLGGAFQQTTSGLVTTNRDCYERSGPDACYATYGFEYRPGFDDAYITWISDARPTWTILQQRLEADPRVDIGQRIVSREPMYIIANLGLSPSFGDLDLETIEVPATMSIDWIRVYQPANAVNIGCDPKEFPTAKYIETYKEAYENANLTTWEEFGQPWPKSRMDNEAGTCD